MLSDGIVLLHLGLQDQLPMHFPFIPVDKSRQSKELTDVSREEEILGWHQLTWTRKLRTREREGDGEV